MSEYSSNELKKEGFVLLFFLGFPDNHDYPDEPNE